MASILLSLSSSLRTVTKTSRHGLTMKVAIKDGRRSIVDEILVSIVQISNDYLNNDLPSILTSDDDQSCDAANKVTDTSATEINTGFDAHLVNDNTFLPKQRNVSAGIKVDAM